MHTLTAEYVRAHLERVHTYESFGRAIAELAVRSVAEKLTRESNGIPTDTASFAAEVKVAAVQSEACMSVTVCIPFAGCSSIHVGAS